MSLSWKEYWNKNADENYYEKIAKFYRRNFFALEGKIYTEKYFLEKGIFMECGSGASECSIKIPKKTRSGVAVDLCNEPLKRIDAPIIENALQSTIFKLPFKDNTIDGIWNFGVMEHFKDEDLNLILKEFNRVLKNDGRIVLFWPWEYGPFNKFHSIIGYIKNILSKYHIKSFSELYPAVLMPFKNKNSIQFVLESCGFFKTEFKLSPYGLFTHYVVIAAKLNNSIR